VSAQFVGVAQLANVCGRCNISYGDFPAGLPIPAKRSVPGDLEISLRLLRQIAGALSTA